MAGPGRPRSVRTPENIATVRDAILQSPDRSTRRMSQALNIERRSLRRILKSDLGLFPYKVQVTQTIYATDKFKRLEFCNTFLEMFHREENFIEKIIMSDEAHFHLSGYVNKQNTRFWATENPKLIHEKPLHSEYVTVWCGVSWHGIIGPYFFTNENGATVSVNSARYQQLLRNFLVPKLEELGLNDNIWFQQDGATAHTAKASRSLLREIFPHHLISKFEDIPWPPRSPDLTAPDFFLWGFLKSTVYRTKPRSLDDLRHRINHEVMQISQETIHKVMHNVCVRVQECADKNGNHLSSVIFKK